jgi:deazaflavin-dependent oxidoreductase (nitroreductase family)
MSALPPYLPSPIPWVAAEVEQLIAAGRTLDGREVIVLQTTGARTGAVRKTPLMRVEHAGRYAAVASVAGGLRHPAWYANLTVQPSVELLDAGVLHLLTARELQGPERAAWWSRACTVFPSYVDYQSRTRRVIPVVLLEP